MPSAWSASCSSWPAVTIGAISPAWRMANTKVDASQWRCGTMPCTHTRWAGSQSGGSACQHARSRRTSGRACAAAFSVFCTSGPSAGGETTRATAIPIAPTRPAVPGGWCQAWPVTGHRSARAVRPVPLACARDAGD
jgi:hypothetical protein